MLTVESSCMHKSDTNCKFTVLMRGESGTGEAFSARAAYRRVKESGREMCDSVTGGECKFTGTLVSLIQ